MTTVKLVDALKICRKVVEAFRIRLNRCGARQTEQCVRVAGIAGIQNAAGTVQIDHGSRGMTRHGNGLNLHAAEVEHVAVLNRQRLHCARRHNVFLFGHKRPLRLAAAHHKSVALIDVAVLVQKRNVRRVHIAFPVLKRCASVIHMSVRQHKRNGQIGTFAYKRFQTAYACKTIDKQRFFTAFDQIAKLAAQTADLRNIVKNLSACKKLGQNKRLLRKFAALPPFYKAAAVCAAFLRFSLLLYDIVKKMSIRKSRLTGLFTLHLKQIFIIRKYFTALLTVNRAFYLPFYEKRQKSSCIFGGYVV